MDIINKIYDQFLIITFIDSNYYDVYKIWIKHYKKHNIDKRLIIFGLDDNISKLIDSEVINISKSLTSFADLWIIRCEVIDKLLKNNNKVLHTDVDCLWLKNPFTYHLREFNDYDIISSQGTIFPYNCVNKNKCVLCMGFIYFNNTDRTKNIIDQVINMVYKSKDDQKSLNNIIKDFCFKFPDMIFESMFRDKTYIETNEPIYIFGDKDEKIMVLPHRNYVRNQNSKFISDDPIIYHPLTAKIRENKIKCLTNISINKKKIN
jgi:hypothetical protein